MILVWPTIYFAVNFMNTIKRDYFLLTNRMHYWKPI